MEKTRMLIVFLLLTLVVAIVIVQESLLLWKESKSIAAANSLDEQVSKM